MSVKPYGAFVDIGGGVSGLLHISQISHDRIANVDKVLSEGDRIKVRGRIFSFLVFLCGGRWAATATGGLRRLS